MTAARAGSKGNSIPKDDTEVAEAWAGQTKPMSPTSTIAIIHLPTLRLATPRGIQAKECYCVGRSLQASTPRFVQHIT